ncbi:hypothetical protein EC968_000062 [Mortierella alpina]|nr:hypothetical protein EC968_000062 [Mortierella alpina]
MSGSYGGLWSFWLTNNLIRRWFIHYEPRPAMIRLFTLGTIYWFSVVFFVSYFGTNEPIWPWMVICAILAFSQTIQISHFRVKGHYKLDGKDKPRRDSKSLIYRTVLIPGGIVSFITMVMLLHQNNMRPSTAEAIATGGAAGISATSDTKLVIGAAQIQVLIIILSSWSPKAFQRRQDIRDTTLRLVPPSSSKFAYTYKFILGEAPNSHTRNAMGGKISEEIHKHDDILLLPVSDAKKERGFKVFKTLEWSNKFKFDYLCKTDDNIFVRWDTVVGELMEKGPSHYYWRGLAFWDMDPIADTMSKIESKDAKPGILPPFVASTLYIMSRDIVTLLTYPGPRIFTKFEDQNIGIWLHAFNIKPIHDKRIQSWDVCENDMIAKHFDERFKPTESIRDMYKNVVDQKPLCAGFRQDRCAPCYPCIDRGTHWADRGLDCDSTRGITLMTDKATLQRGLTVDIKDAMPSLGQNPEWIIPSILSSSSSIYSDTEEWARLHWAIWTDSVSAWKQRHYQAIESTLLHNPNAVLIVLSNTLPPAFFEDYTRQGYQIYVVAFSKEMLLRNGWFFSSETEDWLRHWDEWTKKGPFFSLHLADYLRLVVLYKYGGFCMDMDALWIRVPGDSVTEFIGSDVSDAESDRTWTLDHKNTYLANSVMRFQRGRSMFKYIAQHAFTSFDYKPDCFDCSGPKAITTYVKTHRLSLEKNGLHILPREALFPYSQKEIAGAFEPSTRAQDDILRIEEHGIGLHLYGKATSNKDIEDGSVIAAAFRIWSLDLSRATAGSHSAGPRLQGPKLVHYRMADVAGLVAAKDSLLDKVPGAFTGVNAIFVRGGQLTDEASVLREASLVITAEKGAVAMDGAGVGTIRIQLDLGREVSLAKLNLALSRIRYLPPTSQSWKGTDKVMIQVVFGAMREQLDIPVLFESRPT